MTTARQFDDHDGDFGGWQDVPQPCARRVQIGATEPMVGEDYVREGGPVERRCGAKVQCRMWESTDGGYEDWQYRCEAGHTWWVDGADA